MSAATKTTVTLAERADALATVNDWIAEQGSSARRPSLNQTHDEALPRFGYPPLSVESASGEAR